MDRNEKNPHTEGKGLRRREFLVTLGWSALFASMASTAAWMVRFLFPNVLFEGSSMVKIGRPDDYSPGSVTYMEENRLFVLRDDKGFRILSAVCTHLGCTVNKDAGSNSYSCPCHGSKFDGNGRVARGPAPKPLQMFDITLAPSGHMVVDTKKTVPRSQYFTV
ncbi:MAG: Rieske 2Fe-2S domain-containing protein [Armatimonadetes bacterium]|nr:Rieske 2Fe-2S domain-containing protein [Armatimonadota bacterium]